MLKCAGWMWSVVGGVLLSGVGGCDLSQPPKAYRPSATAAQEATPPAARAASGLAPGAPTAPDAALAEPPQKAPVEQAPSVVGGHGPTRRDIQVMSPERLQALKPSMRLQSVTILPTAAPAQPVEADAQPVAPAP